MPQSIELNPALPEQVIDHAVQLADTLIAAPNGYNLYALREPGLHALGFRTATWHSTFGDHRLAISRQYTREAEHPAIAASFDELDAADLCVMDAAGDKVLHTFAMGYWQNELYWSSSYDADKQSTHNPAQKLRDALGIEAPPEELSLYSSIASALANAHRIEVEDRVNLIVAEKNAEYYAEDTVDQTLNGITRTRYVHLQNKADDGFDFTARTTLNPNGQHDLTEARFSVPSSDLAGRRAEPLTIAALERVRDFAGKVMHCAIKYNEAEYFTKYSHDATRLPKSLRDKA